jgi:cytoskeletal protein CcmA (bactofilin family)
LFTKENKVIEEPQAPKVPVPPSLLSCDLEVLGDLRCDGEIQIDGTLNGNVSGDSVLVGANAVINGNIVAKTVRVHGHVTGEIRASSVSLSKTAYILGDIMHSDLSIEQGAFLQGHCHRTDDVKKPDEGPIRFLTNGLLTDEARKLKK